MNLRLFKALLIRELQILWKNIKYMVAALEPFFKQLDGAIQTADHSSVAEIKLILMHL